MLIIMCGMPFAGKSVVVDMITEKARAKVIRPSDWLPEDIESLGPEEEKAYRIECWRMAMDRAEEAVGKGGLAPDRSHSPGDVVILDQANSKFRPVASLIKMAKRNGHKVALLYVNATAEQCKSRSNGNWMGSSVARDYIDNLRDTLPKFKESCDTFLVIDNKLTREELRQNTLDVWRKLCRIM